jgi:metal-responsive CopG/Arc/MetJ family transcriptional regulator
MNPDQSDKSFRTVQIPKALAKEIEEVVKIIDGRSISSFVHDACRAILDMANTPGKRPVPNNQNSQPGTETVHKSGDNR